MKSWELPQPASAQLKNMGNPFKNGTYSSGPIEAMPYGDYLKTDHWRIRREAALFAADYRCQVCNDPRRLHVHHRTYSRLGRELPSDLTVLCEDCHKMFHENRTLVAD